MDYPNSLIWFKIKNAAYNQKEERAGWGRVGVIMPGIGAVKAEAIAIVVFMHGRPGRACRNRAYLAPI
jgi:hypothetical protein